MHAETKARIALALAVVSFVVVPISYSWVLFPGEDPPWRTPVIAISEWGGLACAAASIILGRRARAGGTTGIAAMWAPRIGVATFAVYLLILFV